MNSEQINSHLEALENLIEESNAGVIDLYRTFKATISILDNVRYQMSYKQICKYDKLRQQYVRIYDIETVDE